MKVVTKFFICGVTCDFGDKNCNNYCNHTHDLPMPDNPATYEDLEMEEIDMWRDVIQIIAEYMSGRNSIYEVLQSKYTIAKNPNNEPDAE